MDDKNFEKFSTYLDSWWPFIITMFISVIAGIRVYAGGMLCPSTNRIDKKIVLITGASSGIGLETAKQLAARGAKIIFTCRNALKGRNALIQLRKEVPDAVVDFRILDVSLMCNIKAFVKQLQKDYDKIDILINNAAMIFQPFKKTVENFDVTLATNYLGPFYLTHLLIPLLKKSDNGRVINLTALAHYTAKINLHDLNGEENFDAKEAFAQSKLALLLFTKKMATLYKDTNITFNCASPGVVRNTAHLSKTFESSLMVKISVWPWIWLFLKTPKQGCQTVVYLAIEPALQNVSGCYFSDCECKEPAEIAKDTNLMDQLYKKSKVLCLEVTDDKETFKL